MRSRSGEIKKTFLQALYLPDEPRSPQKVTCMREFFVQTRMATLPSPPPLTCTMCSNP